MHFFCYFLYFVHSTWQKKSGLRLRNIPKNLRISENCCTFAAGKETTVTKDEQYRTLIPQIQLLRTDLLRMNRLRVYIFLIALGLTTALSAQAQDTIVSGKVFQGFSGGMLFHTGYLFGQDKNAPTIGGRSASPQGAMFGIGGALRVHLWKHFRTGFEGFVSTMPSTTTDLRSVLKPGSYVRVGCGGVLADCCWRLDKVWPYIGGAIGGGSMKGLYILEGDQDSWSQDANSTFHKQAFFYVTPYVGCDYCLTSKVHLSFRLDWLLAIHQREPALPTGPRIYVGIMFCH